MCIRDRAKAEESGGEASYEGGEDKVGSDQTEKKEAEQNIAGVIERSPDSARLILVSSNTFASNAAIDLASQGINTLYTKPLAFLQNAIDWSLEDRGLLMLRGRTQLARTLDPMPDGEQQFWEWGNYGLALLGLLAIWGWRRRVAASDAQGYNAVLAEV